MNFDSLPKFFVSVTPEGDLAKIKTILSLNYVTPSMQRKYEHNLVIIIANTVEGALP